MLRPGTGANIVHLSVLVSQAPAERDAHGRHAEAGSWLDGWRGAAPAFA